MRHNGKGLPYVFEFEKLKYMTKAEIFENLMLPLKSSLTEESWNFLLSRGQMFIEQTSSKNDGKPDVGGSLPCTHTYKTIYIGVGYVAQCTKCGFVRQ